MRLGLMIAIVLVVFAPAAWAQVPLAEPGQPGWVRVEAACFAWNAQPRANETAHWVGRCVNARASGTGKLVWRVDGEVTGTFAGVMRDGRAEGRGTYDWPDGRRYAGDFHEGWPEGNGVFTWPNGDRYLGDFRDGRRDGRGLFLWANGNRYQGDMHQDAITGRGMLSFPGGGRYTGEVHDAVPDGFGIFVSPAGNFGGHWHNGCFSDGTRQMVLGVVPTACP